jgi:RNA polymerase sigma factor (sigma-70 family)
MVSDESVTTWIAQLKAGNHAAAQRLWERYFARMVQLARHRLRGEARRAADEEDAALSAFVSLCDGASRGRFPQLQDRDNLWQLLVVLTARKALNLRKYERRQKRGGGAVRDEAALGDGDSQAEEPGIEEFLGREPTPEIAAQAAEECRRLLDRLGDDDLRTVALWRMEGYTLEEIAAKLGCVPRTVQRKLQAIRDLWCQENAS